MKEFSSYRQQLEPLRKKLSDILKDRALHLSKAKEIENATAISYFKTHCLGMALFPILVILFLVLGFFFGGGKGLIGGFFGSFGLFVMMFFALMAYLIYGVIKMVNAKQEAQIAIKPADIKLDVMKPFLDVVLEQQTGYSKKGRITDLIPKDLMEQGMFSGLSPEDDLTDVIRARMDKTEIIFGEKRVSRYKRVKGDAELLVGGVGAVVDFFVDGVEYEQVQIDSLFMLVDFHKNFDGSVSVHSRAEGESLKEKWQMRKREKMGNPIFDDRFVVYSSSPTLARYILSPLMMERFIEIIDTYRCGLRVLFKNGDMLVQLDWDKNMLETDMREFTKKFEKELNLFGRKIVYTTWSSMDNIYPDDIEVEIEDFERHYNDIAAVFGLVDLMRQNVRIWT